MTKSHYELQVPTCWAKPPERYSFSSLQAIEECPRKWQLLNSIWGTSGRFPQRAHPKAVEGSIIHAAIELLVKTLGRYGMPSVGALKFQKSLAECNFWEYFGKEIDRYNKTLAEDHPNLGPAFTLRTPPRELANQAIRLFKSQYKPLDNDTFLSQRSGCDNKAKDPKTLLDTVGLLAEAEISHPSLPFYGVIDLVERKDGITSIVDFKTGKKKEQHLQQLEYYAVLWWRYSGVPPQRLVVQYMNDRIERETSEPNLVVAEEDLNSRIALARNLLAERPAEARPNEGCRLCPARARCEEGWTFYLASMSSPLAGSGDIELLIATKPSPTGFLGKVGNKEKSVVYPSALGEQLPKLDVGTRLRIVDALYSEEGKTVEIRAWSEVFVLKD